MRLAPLFYGALACVGLWLGARRWLGRWGGTFAVGAYCSAAMVLVMAWRSFMPTFTDASLVACGLGLLVWSALALGRSRRARVIVGAARLLLVRPRGVRALHERGGAGRRRAVRGAALPEVALEARLVDPALVDPGGGATADRVIGLQRGRVRRALLHGLQLERRQVHAWFDPPESQDHAVAVVASDAGVHRRARRGHRHRGRTGLAPRAAPRAHRVDSDERHDRGSRRIRRARGARRARHRRDLPRRRRPLDRPVPPRRLGCPLGDLRRVPVDHDRRRRWSVRRRRHLRGQQLPPPELQHRPLLPSGTGCHRPARGVAHRSSAPLCSACSSSSGCSSPAAPASSPP